MRIPAIITDRSITVTGPDFRPRAIPLSHPNFEQIKNLLDRGAAWSQVEHLIDLPKAISTYTKGRIAVTDGVLTFDGAEVDNALSRRILSLIADKKEATAEPLVNFMTNVSLNPSRRAVEGLYEWLEKSSLPITPDGCIIAWKIVGPNYRDLHSGRFDNSIGKIVEMPRNRVDEDPDRTCSYGLHFCSSDYLPHYGTADGNRIVVVKIHPKDVVAFPRDYNTSKGRACRYEVIGEVKRGDTDSIFKDVNVFRGFDAPTLGEFTKLEIGGVYETREGDSVTIERADGKRPYCFIGSNGVSYTETGEYLAGKEMGLDLVERIG